MILEVTFKKILETTETNLFTKQLNKFFYKKN